VKSYSDALAVCCCCCCLFVPYDLLEEQRESFVKRFLLLLLLDKNELGEGRLEGRYKVIKGWERMIDVLVSYLLRESKRPGAKQE
jgi:hypothetical protein